MAENAFALTADGIELNEFGKLDKDDWDWGHLQPGQFRFCFLPRTPLRRLRTSCASACSKLGTS